ncbi:MAG: hypothetical protein ACFCVK_13130 [Acidimicrobiales bacterium]
MTRAVAAAVASAVLVAAVATAAAVAALTGDGVEAVALLAVVGLASFATGLHGGNPAPLIAGLATVTAAAAAALADAGVGAAAACGAALAVAVVLADASGWLRRDPAVDRAVVVATVAPVTLAIAIGTALTVAAVALAGLRTWTGWVVPLALLMGAVAIAVAAAVATNRLRDGRAGHGGAGGGGAGGGRLSGRPTPDGRPRR